MWTWTFISLGWMSKNAAAASYCKHVSAFLRNCQTVFQTGCTMYFPAIHVWGPFSSGPCHSDGCAVVSRCGIVGISLMANTVEHLFMGFFANCTSSSVKCLFMSFVHFLIRLFSSKPWVLRVLYVCWAEVLAGALVYKYVLHTVFLLSSQGL